MLPKSAKDVKNQGKYNTDYNGSHNWKVYSEVSLFKGNITRKFPNKGPNETNNEKQDSEYDK